MIWSYQAMKRSYHAMKRPYRGLKRNDYLVREVFGILIFEDPLQLAQATAVTP